MKLIALDQWTNTQTPILYGAVTTGADWRFGLFNRQQQHMIQDISLYRVLEGLEDLLRTLIGILKDTVATDLQQPVYA